MKNRLNIWPKLLLAALIIVILGPAPDAMAIQRALPKTAASGGQARSALAQAPRGVTAPHNGEFVWARSLGGPDIDPGHSVFVDESGNVYTTGSFLGTADFDPGPGAFYLTSAGSWDVFISKLDSAGKFIWAKALGGTDWDWGQSVFVDGAGDVYTMGWFNGTADFDPGPNTFNLTSAGNPDVFISKLDREGRFLWAIAFGGTGWDEGQSVYVDEAGDVFATGSFGGTVDFDPGPSSFYLTSAGSADIFISKLDSGGHFVWAKALGGLDYDGASSIFVDNAGDVYTTGIFEDAADFDPGIGVFKLKSAGMLDIFVSKLDGAGDFVWAGAMGGYFDDYGSSVFVDGEGNVLTTGSFEDTADFDPSPHVFDLNAGDIDAFISKLDSAGDFVWARALGGADFIDTGSSIFVDEQGEVYTTGIFQGTADFDPGPGTFNLISAGDYDVFVSKLDSTGGFVWAKALGGTDWEDGSDIYVDGSGNVYTTGEFHGTADFDPGEGTFNLTSAGESDIFVSKLGTAAKIEVDNHTVRSGGEVAITLTIQNQGPADGGGAQLSIPSPANASGFSWTCSAAGGAACPAPGGSGDILHSLGAFPAGGEITYLATGDIVDLLRPVASWGTLSPPAGVNFTGSPSFYVGEHWNIILPWIFINSPP